MAGFKRSLVLGSFPLDGDSGDIVSCVEHRINSDVTLLHYNHGNNPDAVQTPTCEPAAAHSSLKESLSKSLLSFS